MLYDCATHTGNNISVSVLVSIDFKSCSSAGLIATSTQHLSNVEFAVKQILHRN